ncbi:MAG TPA: hypothetical protein VLJ37_11330 [bacterium]|nr:hypothetical protein [bacterium]
MKILRVVPVLMLLVSTSACGDVPSLLKGRTAAAPSEKQTETAQPSRARSIEGVYDVRGTNPGGTGNYAGTATIAESGENYKMSWSVGTSYVGTGRRSGDVLSVEWGDGTNVVGTVKYNIESDGRLTGTWYTKADPNNLGSEILIPRR